MTRNSLFLQVAFLLIFQGGIQSAFAQTAPLDSLNGKRVHVYLPDPGIDSLIPVNNMGDRPLTKRGYWYTGTLRGGPYDHNDGFFFTTPGRRLNLSMSGLQAAEGTRFQKSAFGGKNEIWIIMDPARPLTSAPTVLLEPPKVVNILNPWETTGPRLVLPYGRKPMVTSTERCGWFMAFLLDARDTKLHFEEVNNTATYGKTGLATPAVDYDIAAEFTAKGVPDTFGINLWLDTDNNSWLPTYPKKDGNCQYMMAATIRDFSSAHPDFDFGSVTGDHSVLNVVQPNISAERKPVVNPANINRDPTISFSQFDKWWVTDSTNTNAALRSYESCYDIPMSKAGDGSWEYDSYRDSPDRSFFPLGSANRHTDETKTVCYFDNSTPPVYKGELPAYKRNGNFCMESHATFIYQPGQTFSFRGDDDVWVFINDKMVVDLGGVHTPKSANVNLDTLRLTAGQTYKWDLFYCDRQPCGSSLRIKTSIFFRQQKALDTVRVPGAGENFKVIKLEGGKGSCAGLGDTTLRVVDATNLVYELWNATGTSLDTLVNGGPVQYGGITISTPNVSVDTAKVTGLPPGNYRIIAYEPSNSKLKVEIPFKVPARNIVEVHAPVGNIEVPLGTVVRVIFANKYNNLVQAQADPYVPSFLPAGLDVYLDSLKTRKAVPADYTTDATGYDTLWVTDTVLAAANKSYVVSIPAAPASPTLRITFVVPKVAFQPLTPDTYRLGTLVPVVAVNSVPTVPGRYKLIIPIGLEVYQNPDRTGPVPRDGDYILVTNAAGIDTLWVTGTPAATENKTYILAIQGSNQVSITFEVPANQVEFQPPPFEKTGPMNSVIQITARNMEKGQPRDSTGKYVLIIPAGLDVYTDAARTQRVGADTLVTAANGWDTLWVFADSTANNLEPKRFELKIAGVLQPMVLNFTMPPLDLPKATFATIHDDDADGIPDRLVVTYDHDIAVNPPKAASYRWPSSASAIDIQGISGKVAGSTLTVTGPLTTTKVTGSEGLYTSVYKARNRDSVQTMSILDKMGPVLVTATIHLGQTQDTLRLKFSEPIPSGQITGAPMSLFDYKLLPDGSPVSFTPAGIAWSSDGTEAFLVFSNAVVEQLPKAGNYVRIVDGPGLVADAKGNTAGPLSRFVPIGGLKRPDIRTVTYKEITPSTVLLQEPQIKVSVWPIGTTVEKAVEESGRMGHLIKTDLGDFTVGEDQTQVPLSQVALEYNVYYHSNLGVPVASEKRILRCDDPDVFGPGSNCLQNRGFLFIGWNYTALNKSRVATGAYISRMQYSVRTAGKLREKGALTQTWGVLRRQ